jgi:hypothetical protein
VEALACLLLDHRRLLGLLVLLSQLRNALLSGAFLGGGVADLAALVEVLLERIRQRDDDGAKHQRKHRCPDGEGEALAAGRGRLLGAELPRLGAQSATVPTITAGSRRRPATPARHRGPGRGRPINAFGSAPWRTRLPAVTH